MWFKRRVKRKLKWVRKYIFHWLLIYHFVYADYDPGRQNGTRDLPEYQNTEFPLTTIRANIVVSVTRKDVENIMRAAVFSGIGYWCTRVEVVGETLGYTAGEQISRGGTLRLYDIDKTSDLEPKEIMCYTLTREKLQDGLRMYIERYGIRRDPYGRLDICDIDPMAADAIIQYALFGEIEYS